MNKRLFSLASAFLAIGITGCASDEPEIINYGLDDEGNLVVYYEDGTEQIVGDFEEEIVNGVNSVEINDAGYFVINGLTTDIGFDLLSEISEITVSKDGYYVINGKTTTIKATEIWTVSFNTGYDKEFQPQKIKDGDKVMRPTVYREGYTLIGWFCNGEEWDFNSHVVLNSMTLKAQWKPNEYTITFESNNSLPNPDPLQATYDRVYQLPILEMPGFTFGGWEYKGKILKNSGFWNIADDVMLEAVWTANKYTITLDPNGGTLETASVAVTFGEDYSLPVPENDFGVFTGWYCEGRRLTDENGNSLEPWSFTESKTFTTPWIAEISTIEDLKSVDSGLNGHYILVNDIDLTGVEWEPLAAEECFTGIFDGNGYSIKNLSITKGQPLVGLFGQSSGTIKNLKLENVDINIANIDSDVYIGSLCGKNEGLIECVEASGIVKLADHSASFNSYVGGIVGSTNSTIDKAINNCDVYGHRIVGGVIGVTEGEELSLSHLKNSGNVSSNYVAGGIVAYAPLDLSIDNSVNFGDVSSVYYCGGIVGTTLLNTTEVSLSDIVIFELCGNEGNVTSSVNVKMIGAGGLIGAAWSISCTDVYNNANISGENAGGLAGTVYNSFETLRAYSNGVIEGTTIAGGLIGYSLYCSISDSAVFGEITGLASNSIVGTSYIHTPTILNSFYNCIAETYVGEATELTYEEELYVATLFWGEDNWSFFKDAFPTLKIDFDF